MTPERTVIESIKDEHKGFKTKAWGNIYLGQIHVSEVNLDSLDKDQTRAMFKIVVDKQRSIQKHARGKYRIKQKEKYISRDSDFNSIEPVTSAKEYEMIENTTPLAEARQLLAQSTHIHIGQQIQSYRKGMGIRVNHLSVITGVSVVSINRMETSGKILNLTDMTEVLTALNLTLAVIPKHPYDSRDGE